MPEQQRQPRPQSAPGVSPDHAEQMLEPGVDESLPQPVQNLLSKDYALANINRGDRKYFRLLSDNIALYLQEEFPPRGSLVQGDLGAALLEEPGYDVHELTPRKQTEFESVLMDSFARTSRGVGGWQQEQFSKRTNVRRVEDGRQESEDSGFIGGLFS